jgi:branched-chain amino acid transport system ATP-binding protein
VTLLDVEDVTMRFGGIVALDGLSFDIDEGNNCGLIGPNGAGKTTMFNVVSRSSTDARFGAVRRRAAHRAAHAIARLGIARVQNLALFPTMTLLENAWPEPAAKAARFGRPSAASAPQATIATCDDAGDLLHELGLGHLVFVPAAACPSEPSSASNRRPRRPPSSLLLDEPAAGLRTVRSTSWYASAPSDQFNSRCCWSSTTCRW